MTDPVGGDPVVTAPVCYRHPDRETYIRCSRCERPICPDCMVSAAVGFQCPECVRTGSSTTREGRTMFGGRAHRRPDLVTRWLIGACLAAFVAQVVVSGFTARFMLFGLAVADGQWWRLVTSGFLHGSLMHLFFNLLALWIVGPPLEAALGRARFVALYFGSLVAGSAVSYLLNNPVGSSLGASGAIFGLFGATIVVLRRLRRDIAPFVGLVVVNLLLPLFIPNIDWHAHVGGLVAGVLLAIAFAYAPRRLWTTAAVASVGAVLAVSAVLTVVRTEQIRSDPRYAELLTVVDELEQQIHADPL